MTRKNGKKSECWHLTRLKFVFYQSNLYAERSASDFPFLLSPFGEFSPKAEETTWKAPHFKKIKSWIGREKGGWGILSQ